MFPPHLDSFKRNKYELTWFKCTQVAQQYSLRALRFQDSNRFCESCMSKTKWNRVIFVLREIRKGTLFILREIRRGGVVLRELRAMQVNGLQGCHGGVKCVVFQVSGLESAGKAGQGQLKISNRLQKVKPENGGRIRQVKNKLKRKLKP